MTIQTNFPAIKPTLLLDFANTKQLDPRITFTRASTATYYDSKTTAKAEENLLIRSQEINLWTGSDATASVDTDAAPDGTTTADAVKENSATAVHRMVSPNLLALTASTVYTMSVFIKQKTGTRFSTIGFSSDGVNYASATFNLSLGTNTQTLFSGYTSVSATIAASISGWYRVTLTATTNAASVTGGLGLLGLSATSTFASSSRGFDSYAGDNTSEILYWGAQFEQRSAATAYTPTTTQPITNYIPQLLTAASGVARFDHNPITRESLGLEIEESRANLVLQSEAFDTASWTKGSLTVVSANTVIAPDGTLTADSITLTGSTTTENSLHQSVSQTFSAGAAYTFSVWLRSTTGAAINIRIANSSNTDSTSAFVVSPTATWTRYTITRTFSGSGTGVRAYVAFQSNTSSFEAWGAQLEAGAFATSYIPTVASQVTRAADSSVITGTNFSSWYNAAEGTLYADWQKFAPSTFQSVAVVSDGTGQNAIAIGHGSISGSNNNFRFDVATNNVSQASITTIASSPSNTFAKTAAAYAVNDFSVVSNGGAAGTDTLGTLPVVNRLSIGANSAGTGTFLNGTIKKIAYYPIRVTNTNLQALTS